jgi:hypothetical protein
VRPRTAASFAGLWPTSESTSTVGQGVEDAGEGGTEPRRVVRHELGIGLA